MLKDLFTNPPRRFAANPMMHDTWVNDPEGIIKSYLDRGCAGAVTNMRTENGFTSNPEDIREYAGFLKQLEENDLKFWIYDEVGYPSGQAYGMTLEGHPELAAKGFFMHRRIAYAPAHVTYRLNEECDKIVWAAKYPLKESVLMESFVDYDQMTPVPFTPELVTCDLEAREVLLVFCVKEAYEGSHSTHNVCSYRRNINIMDKSAVKRFIDVAFEPIVKEIPDAYRRAVAVFTDEPSLHVWRAREYEVWPYAIAPWADDLFEAYEKDHGESLLPHLPLIFEGGEEAYSTRVKFYTTVANMIAEAYSGQLAQWCEAHGGAFSGHYLLEERMDDQVVSYGNLISVLKKATYPGVDVLWCYPEIYDYNTTKFAQMAVRKNQTNGMMVELCPFYNKETFDLDPVNNMTAVTGAMYLGGVRISHSYYDMGSDEQARQFNNYVARMGLMLDGLHNKTNVFVYYGIEDTQAHMQPTYSGRWNPACGSKTQDSTYDLTHKIYSDGHDFYYVDLEDLREAAKTLRESGTASISDNEVKVMLVPAMEVMYGEALDIIKELEKAGVVVRFMDCLPRISGETSSTLDTTGLTVSNVAETAALMDQVDPLPFVRKNDPVLPIGKFRRDGKTFYMLTNLSRFDAQLSYTGAPASLYSIEDGSITPITDGAVTVPAMRAVFVVED